MSNPSLRKGSDSDEARHDYRRRLVGSLVRICTVTPAIFVLYAFAPLDPGPSGGLLRFLAALLAFAGLAAWQVVAVVRSSHPRIRAVEAALMCLPILIVLFSSAYFTTSRGDEASFNEPLSRLDAVYFTMTVLSTVGFGDIAARSDLTRLLVIVQIAVNLVVFGVLARVLLRVVERRSQPRITPRG